MVAERQVRRVPYTVLRPVTERIERHVPVQVCRTVSERRVRRIPVTTCRMVYEDRVEQIPVRVCRTVAVKETVRIPRVVEKRIPVSYTCYTPRVVCCRVPLDPCGVPISVGESTGVTVKTTPIEQQEPTLAPKRPDDAADRPSELDSPAAQATARSSGKREIHRKIRSSRGNHIDRPMTNQSSTCRSAPPKPVTCPWDSNQKLFFSFAHWYKL